MNLTKKIAVAVVAVAALIGVPSSQASALTAETYYPCGTQTSLDGPCFWDKTTRGGTDSFYRNESQVKTIVNGFYRVEGHQPVPAALRAASSGDNLSLLIRPRWHTPDTVMLANLALINPSRDWASCWTTEDAGLDWVACPGGFYTSF